MYSLYFVALVHFGSCSFGPGFQGNQLLGPIGVNGNAYQSGFPINGGLPGVGFSGNNNRLTVRPIKVELECVTSNVGRGVIRWVRQTGPVGSEFDVVAEGPTVFDMQRFNVIYTPLLDSWRSKLIINMVDPSLQQGVYLCQSPNPLPPYTIQSSEPFVVGRNQMSQVGFAGGANFGVSGGFGAPGMWRSAGEGEAEQIKEEKRLTQSDLDSPYIASDGTVEEMYDEKRASPSARLTQSDPDSPYINDDGTIEPQYDEKKRASPSARLTQSDPDSPYINGDGTIELQYDEKKRASPSARLTQSDPDSPYINDDGTIEPQYDEKKRATVQARPDKKSEDQKRSMICEGDELILDGKTKKKRSSCSDPSSPFINDDGTVEMMEDKRNGPDLLEADRKKKDVLFEQSSQVVQFQSNMKPGKTQLYEEVSAHHLQKVDKEGGAGQETEKVEKRKSRQRRASKPLVNEDSLGIMHDLHGALDEEGEDYPIYRNNEGFDGARSAIDIGEPEYPIAGIARGTSHVLMKRG